MVLLFFYLKDGDKISSPIDFFAHLNVKINILILILKHFIKQHLKAQNAKHRSRTKT